MKPSRCRPTIEVREFYVLAKVVCERCVNESFKRGYDKRLWNNFYDNNWVDNWVACPTKRPFKACNNMALVNELPPSYCPYCFEHAVAAGISNVEH